MGVRSKEHDEFLRVMDQSIANVRSANIIALQKFVREFIKEHGITSQELWDNYTLEFEDAEPEVRQDLDRPERKFIHVTQKISIRLKDKK